MNYRVITLGREFGCGSGDVARLLAARLGWRLFDRELLDEIARVAQLDPAVCGRADERVESWLHRVGKGLWQAAGEKGPAVVAPADADSDALAQPSRRVIEDLAATGNCVIVGRGGNYILHGRDDAFHLFLYAPKSWRIRRLESQGQTHTAAEAAVHRVDHERAAYIRRYFDQDWPRRQLYHLMLNASLGTETVVAATLAAMGV